MTTTTRETNVPPGDPSAVAGDWRHRAACRGAPEPELWFPVGDTEAALLQTQDAKQICHGCPVRADCLQDALDRGHDFGIFGGLTEDERRVGVRRLKRAEAEVSAQALIAEVERAAARAELVELQRFRKLARQPGRKAAKPVGTAPAEAEAA